MPIESLSDILGTVASTEVVRVGQLNAVMQALLNGGQLDGDGILVTAAGTDVTKTLANWMVIVNELDEGAVYMDKSGTIIFGG